MAMGVFFIRFVSFVEFDFLKIKISFFEPSTAHVAKQRISAHSDAMGLFGSLRFNENSLRSFDLDLN